MDDMLQKYLKDKYGENYDQKAQEDYDSARSQNRWAQLGSDIGDAIGGQKVGSGDQYFQGLNKQAKENTIGKIANDKAQYVKDQSDAFNMQDIADKTKVRDMENDPMNVQAAAVRAQLSKLGVEVPEGMSLADMKRNFGDAKSLNEIKMRSQIDFQNQKQLKQMEQGFKEKENALNRQNDIEKIQAKMEIDQLKKKDPKSLNSTDKARLDNALMVLKGIDDMGAALDKGVNTFSLIGDNPYTQAERRATEGYGRMQSGGAINKDEEARFSKTLPQSLDKKDLQRKKLIDQRNEMISRIKTLGFEPKDLGYEPLDFKYGSEAQKEPDVEAYAQNHGITYEQALNVKNSRMSKAMR